MIVAGLFAAQPVGKDLARGLGLEFRARRARARAGNARTRERRWRRHRDPAARPADDCSPRSRGCAARARYSWWRKIWSRARSESSKQSPTPAQPASSRRVQAKLTRRSATSMPLDQWIAGEEGIGAPPGLELLRRQAAAKASRRAQVIGRGEKGHMLQPARLEQEFVIAGDRGVARLDVEGIGLAGRLDAGIGIAEPIGPGPRQSGLAAEDPQDGPRAAPSAAARIGSPICRRRPR